MTDQCLGNFSYVDAWLEAQKIVFLQNPNNKLLYEKFNSQIKMTVQPDFYTKIPKYLNEQFESSNTYTFCKGLWVERVDDKTVGLYKSEEFDK